MIEPSSERTIVLIGPMAVGKTTIGTELAALTGRDFADSDQVFEAKSGKISQVFASRGEQWFRQQEARIIAELIGGDKPLVLSVGGGAVLDSGTQQLLAKATVVFLEADLETVRERIIRSLSRPLLNATGVDPLQKWLQLFSDRELVYRKLADLTLDVRHGTPQELASTLKERIWPVAKPHQTDQIAEESL